LLSGQGVTVISHRRESAPWTSLWEWLVDGAIGFFFGFTGALVLLLITLWVQALHRPM
jgi:hypothetical protein